jgi:hypothetical protein
VKAERWLLALLARGAEGIQEALTELSEADVDRLHAASVLRAAKALWRRGEAVDLAALSAQLPPESEELRLLNRIAVEDLPEGEQAPSAVECVRTLQQRPLEARTQEIQKTLNSGPASDELLREKQRLTLQARQLAGS